MNWIGPSDKAATTDRRGLLKLGAIGLGGMALPVQAVVTQSGFTHNVASGEPGADRVLLWTRYVGTGDAASLRYEVSETDDFAKITAQGEVRAEAERDWCAKVAATGLGQGRWYFYRFVAPGGEMSPIGRTRTLPTGPTAQFRMAVFSCANYAFGWFNAYAHATSADDFDVAVHLGDYLYEYKRGEYPTAKQALSERVLYPANEIISLADYRTRYAAYRSDPDLQRLHQLYPMIAMWDDHEVANDSWKDGAENHDPATEGEWSVRKAAARKAYREWLPVSDEDWAQYQIGDLATLFRLETRLDARSKQFVLSDVLKGVPAEGRAAALAKFRDGPWRDPSRTLMGPEQEAWLAAGMAASVKGGTRWQVVAQQIVMGDLFMPELVRQTMSPRVPGAIRTALVDAADATAVGLPFALDSWSGYPAARSRLLDSAAKAKANMVVLSGDSHNAWGCEFSHRGKRVGVEFAGTSVSSPGAEGSLPWLKPDQLAAATVACSPELKWCDTSRRGYMLVTLTPKIASSEFRFLKTVRERSTELADTHTLQVEHGRNRLSVT